LTYAPIACSTEFVTTELSETLQLSLLGRELVATGRGAHLRRAAGITQRQLADEIDVDVMTVSRWERRQRLPRPAEAARYARVLKVLTERL
jgi:DNA-binding transcriptional regulator YiaG